MNNDFTWEKIMDWVEGRMTDEAAQKFGVELAAASEAAQADVAWLRAFYKLSDRVPLRHLSDATRQRLRAQFEQLNVPKRAAQEPLAALSRALRVFVATLSSDSWTMPLVGVRHGGSHPDSRQLIYKSDLAEVALNIRSRSQTGSLDLRGQIFANASFDFQTVSAQLVQNQLFRQAYISHLGDFVFGNVLPGQYALTLSNDDFEIAFPSLSLSL